MRTSDSEKRQVKIIHCRRRNHPVSIAACSTCSWRSRVFSVLETEPHPALKMAAAFERFTLPDLSEKKVKRAQIRLGKLVPNLRLTHDGWSGDDGMEEVFHASFVLSNLKGGMYSSVLCLHWIIVEGKPTIKGPQFQFFNMLLRD